MGSWYVVSSSKWRTKVGGGRVVSSSMRRRQTLVAVYEGWYTEEVELSWCELVTEVLVMLVVHDLVTETVVVKLSGCQLVMVLAVHDGGW